VRGEKGICRGYCEIGRGVRILVWNWECEWILGGWIERSQGRVFWSQREEVRGVYFACYISCLCFSCCSGCIGMYKLEIHCLLSRFLEIPRNRLAGGSCLHSLFSGFVYAPPSGYVLPARRHKLSCSVFSNFWMFFVMLESLE